MGNDLSLRLSHLSTSLKVLTTAFVLAVALGYGVSLLQVAGRTGLKPRQTITHYRGSEDPGTIEVPQSYASMLSISHVHSFSQPLVLGLIGLLFALTTASERSKVFWILLSFIGSLSSNAGPWLIRYLSPHFVHLLYMGGSAMFASFAVMAPRILIETWRARD